MCSGAEAGSYLRLIDFVYHSTLGLGVTKKKKEPFLIARLPCPAERDLLTLEQMHSIYMYRGTSLIRNRPPPRTTIGP